jgi:hypothetical protein
MQSHLFWFNDEQWAKIALLCFVTILPYGI